MTVPRTGSGTPRGACDLETMHDSDLPTFLMRASPIISTRTRRLCGVTPAPHTGAFEDNR